MSDVQSFPFTVGDAMRRARIDAGLSPEEVAVELKVGYRTVLNWENDKYMPRGRTLLAFAELTRCPWLLETIRSARTRSRCFAKCADQELSPVAA